ncbi:asparagine synthetase A [Marinimicrobium locisalis]|uniref:asparagine synthetase A n=1 Tax=Marinimicrobium locisalis TaxID=546022 RepID=UPI0032221081
MDILFGEEARLKSKTSSKVKPSGSWRDPLNHFKSALRDPWYKGIHALTSSVSSVTAEFYLSKNISPALLPVTTGSISSPMGLGSDSLPVNIELGGIQTYLADSMQFLLEYSLRFEDAGAYYIMPSFRGEEQDERHLNQFYHSEAEIAGGLDDVIALVNEYVSFLAKGVTEKCSDFLATTVDDASHIEQLVRLGNDIPRIRHDDAVKLLNNEPEFVYKHPDNFLDITNAGERCLLKEFGSPVWLTHMPQLAVPFYQANEPGTEFSLTADLLMGIGETVGAGERNVGKAEVLKNLEQRQVSRSEYEWYIEMRDIAPMRTAGFGMGIERFILWMLKHDDIRDTQILPRKHGINILP